MFNLHRFGAIYIIAAFVCLLYTPTQIHAASKTTYHNPIVYIGADGNVYMTSLDQPLRTGILRSNKARFGNVRWSPDSSRFVVAEFTPAFDYDGGKTPITPKLYLVESGNAPKILSRINIGRPTISAWSPDGSHLAYISDESPSVKLMSAPIDGGEVTELGHFAGCIAEGPKPSKEAYLEAEELGASDPFGSEFSINWTPYGILFGSSCGATFAMISPDDGTILWKWENREFGSLPIVSHDGKYALAANNPSGNSGENEVFSIDLVTGRRTALMALKNTIPLGWTSDNQEIFYVTQSDGTSVNGDVAKANIGKKLFDQWPISGYRATFAIWQIANDGSGRPRQLFQREGYGLGVLAVMPDNSAIISSFITSSAKRIQAINEGATLEQANAIPDGGIQIISVPLRNDTPQLKQIALGGQPAIGNGNFEVGN